MEFKWLSHTAQHLYFMASPFKNGRHKIEWKSLWFWGSLSGICGNQKLKKWKKMKNNVQTKRVIRQRNLSLRLDTEKQRGWDCTKICWKNTISQIHCFIKSYLCKQQQTSCCDSEIWRQMRTILWFTADRFRFLSQH